MARHLCMLARIPGTAGPANFQRRLEHGLHARNVQVSYGLVNRPCGVLLVIGATRNLASLRRASRDGIPIVQRLNGMNWIHRQIRTGLKHYLRAEINNLLLRWIRAKLADFVIYQSHFAQEWWEQAHGIAPVPSSVIYNGVPLDRYTPDGKERPPEDRIVILMVEGNLSGGYEVGVESGVDLARKMQERVSGPVKLQIAGNAPQDIRSRWKLNENSLIHWLGLVSPDHIPALARQAHLLYSGDPNPACPNAVIEAMACGLPIVAFNTGALPEIVTQDAGQVVDYGGDPWRLEKPDIEALVDAAIEVAANQDRFRKGARQRAVESFGQDRMVEAYLEVFQSISKPSGVDV
jgi:glycosyltransferase involved in cell wall biosynthesis